MTIKYDSTNKVDILKLAERIRKFTDEGDRRTLATMAVSEGLMLPQDEDGELMIKAVETAVQHGATLVGAWAAVMMLAPIQLSTMLVDGLVQHMLFGVDQYDEFSAGGFCQDEINTIVAWLDYMDQPQ